MRPSKATTPLGVPINKIGVKHFFKHVSFLIGIFFDKELTLYAASLSFYTIFTLIPLLLITLTLLTSLPSFAEHYESVKTFIVSNLMPVNSESIMGYIDSFLLNSAKMGVIGLVMVLIASLLFFKNFEYIANKIFHAKKENSLGVDYNILDYAYSHTRRSWSFLLHECHAGNRY